MIDKNMLRDDVQQYITDNLNQNLNEFILRGSPFSDVSIQAIAQQIQAKKKAEKKIPIWFASEKIYYPPQLNLEQTSSQITANYKSSLIHGEKFIDLTGGFGIDHFFFAEKFAETVHCELNPELAEIAAYNYQQLTIKQNTIFHTGDGLDYLKNTPTSFDWIYLDPSRRDDVKGKVFRLEDCTPNIVDNLEFLLTKTDHILLKTSPLLDLKLGVRVLKYVQEIHIVAVKNEVKELLWKISKNPSAEKILVKTVNFQQKQTQEFEAFLAEEEDAAVEYGDVQEFLYEPNAAILKSGFFETLAKKTGLTKLAKHSHLYTSAEKIDFPGRRFKVLKTVDFHKREFQHLGLSKANVTTRNFPMSVNAIRKKLKLKDGGSDYLFFTTNQNENKLIIHGQKV